jgi:hypothetical protein
VFAIYPFILLEDFGFGSVPVFNYLFILLEDFGFGSVPVFNVNHFDLLQFGSAPVFNLYFPSTPSPWWMLM